VRILDARLNEEDIGWFCSTAELTSAMWCLERVTIGNETGLEIVIASNYLLLDIQYVKIKYLIAPVRTGLNFV
jgi:hypothetical protein